MKQLAPTAAALVLMVACGSDPVAGPPPVEDTGTHDATGFSPPDAADAFSPPEDIGDSVMPADSGPLTDGATEDLSPNPVDVLPDATADVTVDVSPDAAPDVVEPPDPPVEAAVTSGYWSGVAQDPPIAPYGRRVVIVCHNCYVRSASTPAENLIGTLDALHQAQAAGADGLELDVTQEDGVLRVDHDDNGQAVGAPLADVLADPELQAGNQLLFIEVKVNDPKPATADELLATLLAVQPVPRDRRPRRSLAPLRVGRRGLLHDRRPLVSQRGGRHHAGRGAAGLVAG